MNRISHQLFIALTLILFAFLIAPRITLACALAPKKTVLEAYEDSDVVVIARAVSVEKTADESRKPMLGTNVSATTMEVQKVFKGNLRVGDKVVFGQGNGIRCTWVFHENDVGKEYLFYLHSPPTEQDLWYEFGYSRSHLVEYVADDLLYLNNMEKLRGRTRVSGVLDDEGLGDRSVEGRKIRIIGRNKTYVATTDKNGVYELYDLPPGRYVLEPHLDFGFLVDEFTLTRPPTRREMMSEPKPSNRVAFTLRPRKHFGVDIRLKLSNHVSGFVYDANSKPMQWVCVSLVPANDERYLGCNSLTDERGRFQIDKVESGSYVLILNHENKLTERMPFPKLYYPGVTARENAKVINVKHGESVKDLSFIIRK